MRVGPTGTRPFAVLVLILFAASSSAAVILDQQVDAFASSDPNGPLGGPSVDEFQFAFQTFTVGVAGTLVGIDVQAQQGSEGTPTADLVLTVRNTLPNGEPDRTQDLGSVSLPVSSFPAFTNFTSAPFTTYDVSGLNISVVPGDVLAFELSSQTDSDRSYFVWDSQTDIYAGGEEFLFGPGDGAFFAVTRDLGFRTAVLIPEPVSLMLVSVGGLLLSRRWRID